LVNEIILYYDARSKKHQIIADVKQHTHILVDIKMPETGNTRIGQKKGYMV